VRRGLQRSRALDPTRLARLTREAPRILEQDPPVEQFLSPALTGQRHGRPAPCACGREALLSEDLDVRQWVAYAGLDP